MEPFVFMAVSYDEGHVQGFQGQCARSAKEKACLAAARLSMREHDRSEGDDILATVSARLVMKSSRHLRA